MKDNRSFYVDEIKCPGPEQVMDFLGGEMDDVAAEAVKRHLGLCSSCRIMLNDLSATMSELKSLDEEHGAREDLVEKILHAVPDVGSETGLVEHAFSLQVFLRLAAGFIVISIMILGFGLLRSDLSYGPGVAVRSESLESDVSGKSVAVVKTLQWLASVQQSSGDWDAVSWGGKREYSLALNGLALLTFARSGDLTGMNTLVMDRSVKYLLRCQNEAGLFGSENDEMMYNHGIVSVALLEAYAVTRDPKLKASVDKALTFIRGQQLNTGGWGYVNRPGEIANTPVTLWQLQALLLSAKLGWEDKGYSLKRGLRWFSSMVDNGGQLGYERPSHFPEGSTTLTAMGAFCIFSASGVEKVPDTGMLLRLKQALDALKPEDVRTDYYGSYFKAAALKSLQKTGGQDGRLADLQHSLIAMQESSGGNAGSWSPNDRWGGVGGRIYSTAVAGLTLGLISRNTDTTVPF
ncbi:MAG: hypothetical protein A2283_16470 [Lentisphaerae bacterium RIFOXYA12_FULL_48_11]|nr:MAG: hypothetical protein A2283_16470 [Lentisphaerae bacterium RIFOXYA12_FULL_48_11]